MFFLSKRDDVRSTNFIIKLSLIDPDMKSFRKNLDQFSGRFLIIWAVVTIVVSILDYIIPAWGTKKFGGSKRGVLGSMIGLLFGLFLFPPFGIIIGPFVGAVLGEITGGKDNKAALKAGLGSFVGFLLGTLMKLIVSGMMAWYFIAEIIKTVA
ncbi:MAG: hypothetical protein A2W90_04055 [Bacteroidetes bacterium GWF2_42_66]|nr:MAG: hypothetical protein A2W92_07850 [Bacteroidetes bacterium GWA2_42_15]OFY02504.1 MAG: hypothetical protein A2W89_21800 [Bacteroidetes bacterium GWE2_42_39]OFY41398.1 MAG: hypothetical protein A2W90_04055 [Bacteroidetes bacterium GWF2_42_66]HBL75398.1 DUF456 domain-containing protein [Prolixibacteraceae bacterium]HCR90318.1 DUF456 domain-containing protein [Prolixibacteraceae bacterium]